jgi:hypothetical protein
MATWLRAISDERVIQFGSGVSLVNKRGLGLGILDP